jgi:hypothetical protein
MKTGCNDSMEKGQLLICVIGLLRIRSWLWQCKMFLHEFQFLAITDDGQLHLCEELIVWVTLFSLS